MTQANNAHLPAQVANLSDAALEHLMGSSFSKEDNLGSMDIPEDETIAVELRDWLKTMGARALQDELEGEEPNDVLEEFTFDLQEDLDGFDQVYQALMDAPIVQDIVVFHNRSVTRKNLAGKDKVKLNILKLNEERGFTPANKIRSEPSNNPRQKTSRKGLIGLALSISKTGLRHDIAIRPHPNVKGEFLVIYGYRRFLAIQYAIEQKWLPTNYPVGTRLINANDSQARLLAIEENNGREEVDPLDQAEAFAELLCSVTPATLAKQNGMTEAALKSALTLAFDTSDNAKAAYRRDEITLEQLKALSVGSFAKQDEFLKGDRYMLGSRPEYIVGLMQRGDFHQGTALFSLEQYQAAGGELEEHMFHPSATKFLSLNIVAKLQREALEVQQQDFIKQGYGEVIVCEHTQEDFTSKYMRASQQTPVSERIVVLSLLPDLTTRVSKDCVRIKEANPADTANPTSNTSSGVANPSQNSTGNQHQISNSPTATEESLLTERAAQIAKQTKTNAIQTALLTKGNRHLITALTVFGMIDSQFTLLQRRSSSKTDPIQSPVILAALESWSNRLPTTGHSDTNGISSNHKSSIDLLETLVGFTQEELDELQHLLVAASIGDWNTSPQGISSGKTGSNPLAQVLANHLDIKGHEAWEPNTEYYQAVGYNKLALEAHLEKAFGKTNAKNLLQSSTKAALVETLLKSKDKLSNWTPPELDYGKSAFNLQPNASSSVVETNTETNFVPQISYENDFSGAISAD